MTDPAAPEPTSLEEGVRRLESTLAGTRVNAARAMRELHTAMQRDVRAAEKRARQAERRLERSRERTRQARERARRAELRVRRLRRRVEALTGQPDPAGAGGMVSGMVGRLRRIYRARKHQKV